MKQILTIILGILILTNCSNGTNEVKQGRRELVPNPEKYEHDGYSEFQDTLKPYFKPDTTVGEIRLLNSINIDKYLGENVMDRLVDEPSYSCSIYSIDKNQRLTVYFHPGGTKKEFSEFKVDYVEKTSRNNFVTTDKEFITESKIKLGMTIGDLKAIKGEPDSISKNNTIRFHYKIDDFENSEFLKKYNYPSYYADYEFENGYLIEFRFGFEYP
jgi:hypothetical protein